MLNLGAKGPSTLLYSFSSTTFILLTPPRLRMLC